MPLMYYEPRLIQNDPYVARHVRLRQFKCVAKGEVILTTFATDVVKETKFQVVDMEMAYNMIMGRPWIHDMDAVPSTLHQVIKFPSP